MTYLFSTSQLQLKNQIPVGSYRSVLVQSLVVAVFDTWNLDKLDVPNHYLCYMGNFGEAPSIANCRSRASVLDALDKHRKNRENNAHLDFSFC